VRGSVNYIVVNNDIAYHQPIRRIQKALKYQVRCCGTGVWQENMSLRPRLLAGGTLVLGERK